MTTARNPRANSYPQTINTRQKREYSLFYFYELADKKSIFGDKK